MPEQDDRDMVGDEKSRDIPPKDQDSTRQLDAVVGDEETRIIDRVEPEDSSAPQGAPATQEGDEPPVEVDPADRAEADPAGVSEAGPAEFGEASPTEFGGPCPDTAPVEAQADSDEAPEGLAGEAEAEFAGGAGAEFAGADETEPAPAPQSVEPRSEWAAPLPGEQELLAPSDQPDTAAGTDAETARDSDPVQAESTGEATEVTDQDPAPPAPEPAAPTPEAPAAVAPAAESDPAPATQEPAPSAPPSPPSVPPSPPSVPQSAPSPAEADQESRPGEEEPPQQAEAAASAPATPASGPPSGGPPRRTFGDWLRPDRSQVVVALVLALFAFGVVAQTRGGDDSDSLRSLRQRELVEVLDTLNQETNRLESELAELENTREQLESGRDNEELARAQAEERLTDLKILAGTAPAYGSGVRITIEDPEGNVRAGILLDAIEEMRDAGAEAIEVNDEVRVVASSWVGGDEGGLVIDDTTVRPPYVLEVIGDPHALDEAAAFRGGLTSQVEDARVGGTVHVQQVDDIAIESLHEPREPEYAEPVDEMPED